MRSSTTIRSVVSRALPIFFSGRLMAVVFVPLIGAAIAWVAIAALSWQPLVHWLATSVFDWSGKGAEFLGILTAAMALLLAAVATALVAISILAMPVIVNLVAAREFPSLERRKGGTFSGSVINALSATAMFVALWLLALPLLVFPPAYVVANLLINANLNRRMLPYDALAEHADRDELDRVRRESRKRLFLLGLTLAPLSLVPVVNFFASLFAGVAFTILCLDELAKLRAVNRQQAPQ
nr:putative transmembrane protein [uncultured bacterium]